MTAASATSAGLKAPTGPVAAAPFVRRDRARRINREAGRALEILGHAIEYLSDEFVHQGSPVSAHDPRVEAVQMLMCLNRSIYCECPEIPSLRERCAEWLRRLHLA